ILAAIRTEYQITGQKIAVAGHEGGQLGTPNLFLSFEEEFDVDWQSTLGLEQRLNAQDRREHVPLIVARTARVHAILDDRWFKRRMRPQFQRIYRLSIEVAVDQHCRLTRRVQPFSIDNGMATRRQDLHLLKTGAGQTISYPPGRALDFTGVRGQ